MIKNFLFGTILVLLLVSCQEDQDDIIVQSSTTEVNDFVWKALNIFYLYKESVLDLADDRFITNEAYTQYLSNYQSPVDLFNDLKFTEDRFSIIVEDFRLLESSSQGVSAANGMRFASVQIQNTNLVFGVVRYVVPGSPADIQGVERGMIFTKVDGVTLTVSNFRDLLSPQLYTIGLAQLQDDQLIPTGQEIELGKVQLSENPIHVAKTIDVNGTKVGYLMYNAFRSNYQSELNQVFGQFLADGINDLVLDLRYNGGGSIETAKDLSSMITGQFEDELFAKLTYNQNFEDQTLLFDDATADNENINNLNLNRVYVLTSVSSASASELVINALSAYVEVIHIGETTVGKYQGSTILYDSSNYNRQNVNPGHYYALQPLIFEIENADGFTGFDDGLIPDISIEEDFFNLGNLGSTDERLLERALIEILPERQGGKLPVTKEIQDNAEYKTIGESGMYLPDYQRMYLNLHL